MHNIPNVSHLLLSVGQIAINSGDQMSLEENMKRTQESQDIFICFHTRFSFFCFDNSCIELDVTWLGCWFKH